MEQLQVQTHKIDMKNACVHFMFSYQNKDVNRMMSACDPAGEVYFAPLGEAGRGKIGDLGKNLWSLLIDCFPDISKTIDAIVSDGQTVRCQVLLTGTQAKDFAGIPSKGKQFNSDHIFIFQLNDRNEIDRLEIQWDHADFVRQLS